MRRSLTGRLIIAIVTTVLEEAILAAVMLWVLPQLDIHVPIWALITITAAWAANAVIFYQIGSRALRRRPVPGLGKAIGNRGRVVKRLAPHGMVRIGRELWEAKSASGDMDVGEEVTVIEQDGLKLTVTRLRDND